MRIGVELNVVAAQVQDYLLTRYVQTHYLQSEYADCLLLRMLSYGPGDLLAGRRHDCYLLLARTDFQRLWFEE
jgi:hypothetical protein